jgi:hypothetical protein
VLVFNDIKRLSWKVVLKKEVCFRRKMFGAKDVFITTTSKIGGLSAPITLLPPPNNVSLIGAIEF